MKTTHQLAEELYKLPNVPLVIEGWTGDEMHVKLTSYDPERAILMRGESEEARKKSDEQFQKWQEEYCELVWLPANFPTEEPIAAPQMALELRLMQKPTPSLP